MRLKHKLFFSEKHDIPRFKEDHDWLIDRLKLVCKDWIKYFDHHLTTSFESLKFKTTELPWKINERVLVSSLAASIIRANKFSIVMEELPVPKGISNGRCDLWAHIPSKKDDGDFNFYLEAKKFRKERGLKELKAKLDGKDGIKRMFADYHKSNLSERICQKSAYTKIRHRSHKHYVIGLMAMPLNDVSIEEFGEVNEIFNEVFENKHNVTPCGKKRLLKRYPTAGFVAGFPAGLGHKTGKSVFVCLTVLGKS